MKDGTYPISFTIAGQKRIQEERRLRKPDPIIPRRPRFGNIVKTAAPTNIDGSKTFIYVYLRFDDKVSDISQESTKHTFILAHTAEELALIYGDNLIGLRCRVDFFGADPDQGVATIVNPNGIGNLEKANTMKDFGTLLAPAGSGGMI